jgi:diguanylate cyclase (GGDEF)-like protein
VPSAAITELNGFASDFNALLDELAIWQSHVAAETASLQYRVSHDSLTGLCSRALLEDRLLHEIADANRRGGQIALLLIDCDRFKEINDRYGHAAGDAVLVCISQRLQEQLRVGDVAARLGGDEFAVLVTSGHSIADARGVVAGIRASMQTPITLPGGERIIASLSIGIAMYPEHARDVAQLLHQADIAMYRTKFTARRQGSTPITEGK